MSDLFNFESPNVWIFRISGLFFYNLLSYLDRLLTGTLVRIFGVQGEANPIMQYFFKNGFSLTGNPWLGLIGSAVVTVIFLLAYIRAKEDKTLLMLDSFLVFVILFVMLVVFNNISELLGMLVIK